MHLQVYDFDRTELRDCLELPDWLRVDADDRDLYAAVKRRLAQQPWDDMNDYTDAKTTRICYLLIRDIVTCGSGRVAAALAPGDIQ